MKSLCGAPTTKQNEIVSKTDVGPVLKTHPARPPMEHASHVDDSGMIPGSADGRREQLEGCDQFLVTARRWGNSTYDDYRTSAHLEQTSQSERALCS